MKIKNEKKLNLPQLIEWAYHEGSDVRDEKIESESMTVTFSEIGTPHIETKFHFLQVDELFTVEIEEELTEDTVIPRLGVMYMDTGFTTFENDYINNEFPLDSIQAFYIMNDNLTMTLIWTHEEGLVD